ncbi:MAG TPA: hypothetical protein VFA37_07430 [Gaiellaceae bacterium]|nr:hypothetical protein [Gaiellaceae bacterium]
MSIRDFLVEFLSSPAETDTPAVRQAELAGLLDAVRTRPGERPEDTLIDLGIVDDRRLAVALALRGGRRYEGLRRTRVNPELFLYVPLVVAQRERIVPLMLVGDTLVIASAYLDPDLSYLRSRFPNLELELVVSPRSEILDALNRIEP